MYAVPSFAALLQFIARLIFANKKPAPNQGRVDVGLAAPGIGSGLTPRRCQGARSCLIGTRGTTLVPV